MYHFNNELKFKLKHEFQDELPAPTIELHDLSLSSLPCLPFLITTRYLANMAAAFSQNYAFLFHQRVIACYLKRKAIRLNIQNTRYEQCGRVCSKRCEANALQ